jgi:tetratricopeptide (TPR) repeat protein
MDDQELLREAIGFDRVAQQALLRGDAARAHSLFREAAERYRASWEAAGPRAFGRLIGLLKSSILSGEGGHAAVYVRDALGEAVRPPVTASGDLRATSPVAWYALAIAALQQGDDEAALPAIERMREGGEAFARTADALQALARGDRDAYEAAVTAIVADFAARENHLTGVAFADTAVMLERLAAPRGIAARPAAAVMPVLG